MKEIPKIGQVVQVIRKRYIVTDIQTNTLISASSTSVSAEDTHLSEPFSIEEDDLGSESSVIRELEVGTKVEGKVRLPQPGRFDEPDTRRIDHLLSGLPQAPPDFERQARSTNYLTIGEL